MTLGLLGLGKDRGGVTILRGGAELPLLEMDDERVKGSVEYLGHVPQGDTCGASRQMAVRWILPSSSAARSAGNLRAARAAWIRFPAETSDRCNSSTQYANMEGSPASA